MNAPKVKVGLLSSKHVELYLHGKFACDGTEVTGAVNLDADLVAAPLHYVPCAEDAYAEVKDVTIGVNFHWERKENQCFKGEMLIVPDNGELTVINILPVEDYLKSVISSEMKATSQLELLKAHAVISRSWLLAQITAKKDGSKAAQQGVAGDEKIMRWYDHSDHTLFDVCADDHCQRYQGITRQSTPQVVEAVNATRGQVLMSGDELCDTRFSKCCGGVFEEFETCWAPVHKSYLIGRADTSTPLDFPNLRTEENAERWIRRQPSAFCNTTDAAVLSQVLNGYDLETTPNFYRWEVEYTTEKLSELVLRKSGIDFGKIIDIVPLERGTSGRLMSIRLVGEKRTMEIGKELEIRRILSESHLYSSAFIVEKTEEGFRLLGGGWGHGVGLCQIGAAVMAQQGYDYRQILAHYYPGSELKEI